MEYLNREEAIKNALSVRVQGLNEDFIADQLASGYVTTEQMIVSGNGIVEYLTRSVAASTESMRRVAYDRSRAIQARYMREMEGIRERGTEELLSGITDPQRKQQMVEGALERAKGYLTDLIESPDPSMGKKEIGRQRLDGINKRLDALRNPQTGDQE
jgi:hypothetical protein